MSAPLNYRHLYYFWVVAKEGGIARAAARLDMAVQTVSEQVRALEQSLGHALLKPAGRGLVLTEAGMAAMRHADQIFQLGEELRDAVRDAATGRGMRLYSHALGEAPLAWFAPAALAASCRQPYPACLAELPLLLPTGHAAVRTRLDHWFEQQGIRPRVAGEFEDSALLAAFGRAGMGAFPASRWSREELLNDQRVRLLGDCPELVEHFYLISAERRIQHPLVQRLLQAAPETPRSRR